MKNQKTKTQPTAKLEATCEQITESKADKIEQVQTKDTLKENQCYFQTVLTKM